jgi:hypothetical protein
VAIYATGQVASGNPPQSGTRYQIDYSTDNGKTWKPLVKDWTVPRRGAEPSDFWSQSFCYGSSELSTPLASPVQVRFHNDGGRKYLRAEAHLVYRTEASDPAKVTFDWAEDTGPRRESHVFVAGQGESWNVATGKGVQTRWVEFEPVVTQPGKGL